MTQKLKIHQESKIFECDQKSQSFLTFEELEITKGDFQ